MYQVKLQHLRRDHGHPITRTPTSAVRPVLAPRSVDVLRKLELEGRRGPQRVVHRADTLRGLPPRAQLPERDPATMIFRSAAAETTSGSRDAVFAVVRA
jgi:hypothetical protein